MPNMTLYRTNQNASPFLDTDTPPPFQLHIEHGSGTPAPQERTFTQERLSIGRAVTNTVVLTDGFNLVSQQHAEICWQGGLFWISDLGSKNATLLNGCRLQAGHRYSLRHGDSITVGDYLLGFVLATDCVYQAASNWQ